MSERNLRGVVLMQPGPLHLFWTTGVFYYWELAQKFDVVLIVGESYRSHPEFAKIAALPSTRHVEFIPPLGIVARHFFYRGRFRALLTEHRPDLILVHNRSYLADQYLLKLAREIVPKAARIYYQNGRMSLLWEQDFAYQRAMMIDSALRRYRLLGGSVNLAGLLVDVRNSIAYWTHFKLLPLLTTGAVFRPPVNVFTGKVDRAATIRCSRSEQDILLAYLENEISIYEMQGTQNIRRIRHPVQKVGRELLRFLRRECAETDTILILPSHGFTAQLIEHGWKEGRVIDHVSARWGEAIEALSSKFAGFRLLLKSHPSSTYDPLWQQILVRLQQRFPSMVLVPVGHVAEFYVAESKIIASDVSTVLWWATLWGGKIAISFDIFDYPGGDELKGYEDIFLVQSMEQLSRLSPRSANVKAPQDLEEVLPLARRLAGLS